ncbi:metalloregulator ArsR/SmtB family transcription factor [Leclercia sp.]|uniref:ArsR/SmtB family transcription factor n=1 Tax=Leclercia sp. TaxID=1898428 RepID=UPI0028BF2E89|nr:metalloregulator ArsR/SmtB family transcription factor [Leclercia sp.]
MADSLALPVQAAKAARLLKTLAHTQRLMILCTLIKTPFKDAGALSRMTGLSSSATSQHLRILKKEGLIHATKVSRFMQYRLADPSVIAVVEVLHQIYCQENDDEHPNANPHRSQTEA